MSLKIYHSICRLIIFQTRLHSTGLLSVYFKEKTTNQQKFNDVVVFADLANEVSLHFRQTETVLKEMCLTREQYGVLGGVTVLKHLKTIYSQVSTSGFQTLFFFQTIQMFFSLQMKSQLFGVQQCLLAKFLSSLQKFQSTSISFDIWFPFYQLSVRYQIFHICFMIQLKSFIWYLKHTSIAAVNLQKKIFQMISSFY